MSHEMLKEFTNWPDGNMYDEVRVDDQIFKDMVEGTFIVNPREMAIQERVMEYYKACQDSSQHNCLILSKEMHDWFRGNGYSDKEYNEAKRSCSWMKK